MVEGDALEQRQEIAVRVAAVAARCLQRGRRIPAGPPPARRHQAVGQREVKCALMSGIYREDFSAGLTQHNYC